MNLVYAYPSNLERTFVRSFQVAQTANSLAEAGANVFFMKAPNYSDLSDLEKFAEFGIKMHEKIKIVPIKMLRTEKSRRIRLTWNYVSYVSILYHLLILKRKTTIDAIYARDLPLTMFLLKKRTFLRDIPIIYELHEFIYVSLVSHPNEKLDRFVKMENFVIQNAAALVVVSPATVEYIKKRYPSVQNILAAPNGVDLNFFTPVETNRHSKVIAYSGGLYPWKGVDIAIHALKYLDKDIKLLIIGAREGDHDTRRLLSLVRDLHVEEQVEMLPFMSQQELLITFKRIRAVVIPLPADQEVSYYFTSPLKLFEYMACGLPIIATNVPSLNWILHNRKNALLVRPGDPRALADAIDEIIKNYALAQQVTEEALKDVKEYSWENRGKRILGLLEKLGAKK